MVIFEMKIELRYVTSYKKGLMFRSNCSRFAVFMDVLQQGYIFFDIGTRMRKTYCQVDKITMRTAWNYKCSLYNKDIFIIGCLE
jgi:hypothetical protein